MNLNLNRDYANREDYESCVINAVRMITAEMTDCNYDKAESIAAELSRECFGHEFKDGFVYNQISLRSLIDEVSSELIDYLSSAHNIDVDAVKRIIENMPWHDEVYEETEIMLHCVPRERLAVTGINACIADDINISSIDTQSFNIDYSNYSKDGRADSNDSDQLSDIRSRANDICSNLDALRAGSGWHNRCDLIMLGFCHGEVEEFNSVYAKYSDTQTPEVMECVDKIAVAYAELYNSLENCSACSSGGTDMCGKDFAHEIIKDSVGTNLVIADKFYALIKDGYGKPLHLDATKDSQQESDLDTLYERITKLNSEFEKYCKEVCRILHDEPRVNGIVDIVQKYTDLYNSEYKSLLNEIDNHSVATDKDYDEMLTIVQIELIGSMAENMVDRYSREHDNVGSVGTFNIAFMDKALSINNELRKEFSSIMDDYTTEKHDGSKVGKSGEVDFENLSLKFSQKNIKLPQGWNTIQLQHECKDIRCIMSNRSGNNAESFLKGNANYKFFAMFFECVRDPAGEWEMFIDPRGHYFVLVNDCLFGVEKGVSGPGTINFDAVEELYSASGMYFDMKNKKKYYVKDLQWFKDIMASGDMLYWNKLYYYNRNSKYGSFVFSSTKQVLDICNRFNLVFPSFMSGTNYWKFAPYERFMITQGADDYKGKRFALIMDDVCAVAETSFTKSGHVVNLTPDFGCSAHYDYPEFVDNWLSSEEARTNSNVMRVVIEEMTNNIGKSRREKTVRPSPSRDNNKENVETKHSVVRESNKGIMELIWKIFR